MREKDCSRRESCRRAVFFSMNLASTANLFAVSLECENFCDLGLVFGNQICYSIKLKCNAQC